MADEHTLVRRADAASCSSTWVSLQVLNHTSLFYTFHIARVDGRDFQLDSQYDFDVVRMQDKDAQWFSCHPDLNVPLPIALGLDKKLGTTITEDALSRIQRHVRPADTVLIMEPAEGNIGTSL